MTNKSILLVSAVHPDLLPPIINISKVYMAKGFKVYTLSFGYLHSHSLQVVSDNLNQNILNEYKGSTISKFWLQVCFLRRLLGLSRKPVKFDMIFVFCPVSFFWCSLTFGVQHLIVHCIEIYTRPKRLSFDFVFYKFFCKKLAKAKMVFSPSAERSEDMSGRYKLKLKPGVILNAPFFNSFRSSFDKNNTEKIRVIHTGGVNDSRAILELLKGFKLANSDYFSLYITNVSSDYYSKLIRDFVRDEKMDNVFLLPTLERSELIKLQASSDIGICFIKEKDDIDTRLIAPNKLGEYLIRGLICLTSNQNYFKDFGLNSFLININIKEPLEIVSALNKAKLLCSSGNYLNEIHRFVRNNYNMEHQLIKNKLL